MPENKDIEFKQPEILVPEIASQITEDIAFEKYKLKIELIKWAFGTFLIAFIGVLVNWNLSDRKQGMEEISQYDKYTTELMILNDNPAKKRMLAQFFANVSPSTKIKCGWKDYYKEVDREFKEFIFKDSILKEKAKTLAKDSATLNFEKQQELLDLKNQLKRNDSLLNIQTILPSKSILSSNNDIESKYTIDIFYLETIISESKPFSNKLFETLKKAHPNYTIRLRLLSKIANEKPGYRIDSNQIRYEIGTDEEDFAVKLKLLVDEKGVFKKEQLKLHPVSNKTPSYISIFVRNM